MTAFVFDYSPERALITSDTMASLMGDTVTECGFVGKVYSIPHLRLAICGRGPVQLVWQAYAALVGAIDLRNADEALERLPGILQDASDDYCYQAGIPNWRNTALLEVYAFAWSPSRRRVLGYGAANYKDAYALQSIPRGVHCVPDLGALRPSTNDPVALMKAMQAAFGQGAADIKIGGQIMQNSVSELDIGARVIGRFPDYATGADRAAAGFEMYDRDAVPSAGAFSSLEEAKQVTEAATALPENVIPIRPPADGMNRAARKAAEAEARRAARRGRR